MTDPLQDPGVQGLAQLGRNAIERVAQLEAELAGYVEANRYMKNELEDALEDARKYAEARREIARLIDANRHQDEIIGEQATQVARLREALECCIPALEIGRDAAHVISVFGDDRGATISDALAKVRAALAQVAEVPE